MPEPAEVTCSQLSEETALQLHVGAERTLSEPEPPAASKVAALELSE